MLNAQMPTKEIQFTREVKICHLSPMSKLIVCLISISSSSSSFLSRQFCVSNPSKVLMQLLLKPHSSSTQLHHSSYSSPNPS